MAVVLRHPVSTPCLSLRLIDGSPNLSVLFRLVAAWLLAAALPMAAVTHIPVVSVGASPSNAVFLTVTPPVFSTQPVAVTTGNVGGGVNLSVSATGSGLTWLRHE